METRCFTLHHCNIYTVTTLTLLQCNTRDVCFITVTRGVLKRASEIKARALNIRFKVLKLYAYLTTTVLPKLLVITFPWKAKFTTGRLTLRSVSALKLHCGLTNSVSQGRADLFVRPMTHRGSVQVYPFIFLGPLMTNFHAYLQRVVKALSSRYQSLSVLFLLSAK